MPVPPQLLGQSTEALKTFGADLIVQTDGTQVFSVRQPVVDTSYRIATQWDLHCAGTRISSGNDPDSGYDNYRELQARFAIPSPLVPSGEASLKAFALSAIGTETKPLAQARLLYLAVLNKIGLNPDAGLAFAPEVLKDGKANSFGYANLLTGLLRSVGIPARIIEGVLFLDAETPRTHYWLEFFIPTVGWVQADPGLGDGLVPAVVPPGVNPHDWYFGNIDNRHIALIRGEGATSLTRLDGNIQKLFQRFVLMQVHAESSGYVESYGLFIDTPSVRRVQ
jgi:transglutaminase-like putative cysteine protease